MVRVRFAPSPTGSLHLGNALGAVANRRFADEHGGSTQLRIDDTEASRNVPGGEEAILGDLGWLGIAWDEGPQRQSERQVRHREAAHLIGEPGVDGSLRFGHVTLLRADGSPTYQLASAVDDVDFGITHVIRGSDHRPNEDVQVGLIRALGAEPPEYVHHGLLLGEDGTKLSKRHGAASLADLREAGFPAEAVRAYLEELGLPRHDVHLDLPRVRRLAIESIEAMSDEELAARVGVDCQYVPVMRGARDLVEARRYADELAHAEIGPTDDPETLVRFKELVDLPPVELRRELQAAGGSLKALRLALTGRDKGPELSAILAALPKEEALRRVDQALQHAQP